MKKITKKSIGVMALALTFSAMSAVTSLAASDALEPDAGVYGWLLGTISSYGHLTVQVKQNPDDAYLVLGGTQVAESGETVVTQQNVESERGELSYWAQWNYIHPEANTLFGVHGVQGTDNKAYAIYTSTSVSR